jgi:hypothetical protein
MSIHGAQPKGAPMAQGGELSMLTGQFGSSAKVRAFESTEYYSGAGRRDGVAQEHYTAGGNSHDSSTEWMAGQFPSR